MSMNMNMKKIYLVYSICSLFGVQYIQADEHEAQVPQQAVEQLVSLRRAQQQAWGYDFFAIEQIIEKLKQQYNKVYKASNFAWVQAVPVLSIQILFLALWWILVFYAKLLVTRRREHAIFLLLVMLSVGATALSVKRQEQAIVIDTTPLYIGPDTSYPVKTALYSLDEIIIVQQVKSWYYTTTPERGWVQAKAVIKL
jgi:hypothetical protein